jgi:hypothetical protein
MFAIEEPVSALAVSPITSEDEVSAAPSLPCFYFIFNFHSRPSRSAAHFAVTRAAGDHRHREWSYLHAATAHARRVVGPPQILELFYRSKGAATAHAGGWQGRRSPRSEVCSAHGRWSLSSGRRAGRGAQSVDVDRVDLTQEIMLQ